jgi:hypothetical protein
MKRSNWIIPLAAFALGALVMWFRPVPPAVEAPVKAPSAPHQDEHGHPILEGRPARPEDKIPPGTGGVRIRVHHRGKPLPDADIMVMAVNTERPMTFKPKLDGTQSLVGMPPGEYSIGVHLLPRYLEASQNVRIEAGRLYDADFDLVRGCRIFGTVLNKAGTPLPGSIITLHFRGKPMSTTRRATTNEKGGYELAPVEPGAYQLSVRQERYKARGDLTATLPSHGDEAEVHAILEEGSKLSGIAVDENGAPIAGVTVTATSKATGGFGESDAQGRWTVYGLEGGIPTNLTAEKEGYGTVYLRQVQPDTEGHVLRLATPGTVDGRVVADPPPASFGVGLFRYEESLKGLAPVYNKFFSNTEGRFTLPDVPPGDYVAEIILSGHELVEPVKFTVGPRQVTTGVELKIRPVKKPR